MPPCSRSNYTASVAYTLPSPPVTVPVRFFKKQFAEYKATCAVRSATKTAETQLSKPHILLYTAHAVRHSVSECEMTLLTAAPRWS